MNEKSECDKYFALGVLFVLGLGLCVLAFFCGEEIMRKCWFWSIITIFIFIVLLAIINSYCTKEKETQKEYFTIDKNNISSIWINKEEKQIMVYHNVDKIGIRCVSDYHELELIEFYGKISLGEGAFFGCTNLKEIIFYDDVNSIEKYAFAGCKSLEKITFYGNIPEIVDDTVFKGIENTISIYVIESNLEDAKGKFNSDKFGIKTIVLQTDAEDKKQHNGDLSVNDTITSTEHHISKSESVKNNKIAPNRKDFSNNESNNIPQKSANIEPQT